MKFKSPKSASKSSRSANVQTQIGRIKRHPDGFGFFIPEDPEQPDVYIPRQSMEGIMTNDRVTVTVERERGGDRYRGEIVNVLDRGLKTVVGQFHPVAGGTGVIRDDTKGWGHDLKILKGQSMDAKDGELVAVEILKYPDQGEFTGQVIQVIGDSQDPMNDIQRVILTQNIPHVWPAEVVTEAHKIPAEVSAADIKGRKDLRALNLITIDGATAKDFDDAIYVEMNDQGFVLYVAIADVSHYVKPGTAIDDEAYFRGTSVYFPNFVVPMLPEELSNGLCSLNPHVDRLCLVAEMHMDFQGEVQRSDFYEAVMKSAARVTYGEAQQIMDGESIEKFAHVAEDIERASQLAKILMAKRFREGSLDLEIPEVHLVIDAAGTPVDILRSERLFAHRLIEEMMLAANVAVGKFLSIREIPAIYRIHEPPNTEAITKLEKFMRNFGSRVDLASGKLQKRLTKALEEFQGKPEAQILNILTLRSMSQAKYSPNNLGHFGLGFEFYTHFTSPIRRYPDLIVHRLIKSQVMKKGDYRQMTDADLATAGTMLSAAEQRSVKAERQVQSIKRARFMQNYIGEQFDGMISSVTKFGVFVLLREFEVDGLVSLDRLSKNARDTYEFDPDKLRLVASRSGEAFEIGQMVRVQVANADPDLGQVDFELIRETKQARADRQATQTKGRMERFNVVDELNLDQLMEQNQPVRGRNQANQALDEKSGKGGKKTRGRSVKGQERHAAKADAVIKSSPKAAGRPPPREREKEVRGTKNKGSLNEIRQARAGKGPAASSKMSPATKTFVEPAKPSGIKPVPVREALIRAGRDMGQRRQSPLEREPAPIAKSSRGEMKPVRATDFNQDAKPGQGAAPRFDPEQKLREALARRGLQPTEALRNPESVRKLGARSDDEKSDRRGDRNGRRDRDSESRNDDRDQESAGSDERAPLAFKSRRTQAAGKSGGGGKSGRPNRGGGENRGGKKSSKKNSGGGRGGRRSRR